MSLLGQFWRDVFASSEEWNQNQNLKHVLHFEPFEMMTSVLLLTQHQYVWNVLVKFAILSESVGGHKKNWIFNVFNDCCLETWSLNPGHCLITADTVGGTVKM